MTGLTQKSLVNSLRHKLKSPGLSFDVFAMILILYSLPVIRLFKVSPAALMVPKEVVQFEAYTQPLAELLPFVGFIENAIAVEVAINEYQTS